MNSVSKKAFQATSDVRATYDAFQRQRVSAGYVMVDGKTIFDKQPHLYAESLVDGATSTHIANNAHVRLTVPATTASSAIRQTRVRGHYQAGKGMSILITYNIADTPISGISKRVGYYDDNNGVFLEYDGSDFSIVWRSGTSGSPVDTKITRPNWNVCPRYDLVVNACNILMIEFEWLGSGNINVGFIRDNESVHCHTFFHNNVLTVPYWGNPNLPVRYEIVNDGTAASSYLNCICASVISDGGLDPVVVFRSVDTHTNGSVPTTSNALTKILAIRIKPSHPGTYVYPVSFSFTTAQSSQNALFYYVLVVNPTVLTNSYTFVDVRQPNSHIEVDDAVTSLPTIDELGGEVMSSGYVIGNRATKDISFTTRLKLGEEVDGTQDILVLAIERIDASGSVDIFASMSFHETI